MMHCLIISVEAVQERLLNASELRQKFSKNDCVKSEIV